MPPPLHVANGAPVFIRLLKVGEISFNGFIIKCYLDDEEVDMKAEEWIDPLFPSAVLVSYLNELPNSLLPPDMYEKIIGIAGKILKSSEKL